MLESLTHALVEYGIWGLLLLAFIDSGGIPVAVGMDVLVVVIAAKDPSQAWAGAGLAVIGSLAGNLLLFFLARKGGRRFTRDVPAPGTGHPQRFRAWFDKYGLLTVFIPALVPIPLPLKVFVITAGVLHTPVRTFVAVIVAARVLRYFGEAWMGVALGRESAGFFGEHKWLLLAGSAAIGTGIYLAMRLKQRRASA